MCGNVSVEALGLMVMAKQLFVIGLNYLYALRDFSLMIAKKFHQLIVFSSEVNAIFCLCGMKDLLREV